MAIIVNISRFAAVEGGGLPEITNYDFSGNSPVRSLSNTSFQFEDVFGESELFFVERTSNGDFSAGTNLPTDSEFINRKVTSTDYDNWVIVGGDVYDLPDSVVTHRGNTPGGGIPNVTGVFDMVAQESLHSPVMINTTTSVVLEQRDIPISSGEKYQVYLETRQPYPVVSGSTPNLTVYVAGYTGTNPNNVVTYYDPVAEQWTTTVPNANVRTQNYTLPVKFDFIASNFPGSTPNGYKLVIALTGSALTNDADSQFIIIDRAHVDEYGKRDPYNTILIPSGYLLQIAPDLGWSNPKLLFEEQGSRANPLLSTLGPYYLSDTELVDNQDNTLTITISQADFDQATHNRYHRYFWRVIAVSENGDPGKGGYPAKFEFVGRDIEDKFSIDKIIDDPNSVVKLIIGKKSPSMTVQVNDNASYPGLSYPSIDTWVLQIVMETPRLELKILGVDKSGATTTPQYIVLTSSSIALAERQLWNALDEHALLFDLQRLPNEDNRSLLDRIKDAGRHPPAPTYDGIVHTANRELGLAVIKDAISLSLAEGLDTVATVVVNGAGVRIHTPDMISEESVVVNPIDLTVNVSKPIFDDPIYITYNDIDIPSDKIEFFDEDSDRPDFKKFKILDDYYGGKVVDIKYPYYIEYTFKDYPTIGELFLAIKSLTSKYGEVIFNATLSPVLGGSESSRGLFRATYTVSATDSADLKYSPIILDKISDRVFRETFRTAEDTFWNTKFFDYVTELKSTTNTEWGSLLADRAYWDAADNKLEGYDHIPTQFDPPLTRILSSGELLDAFDYFGLNYSGVHGDKPDNTLLKYYNFIPGVAHTHDLEPDLFVTSSIDEVKQLTYNDAIGTNIGSSRVVFFSGNIIDG